MPRLENTLHTPVSLGSLRHRYLPPGLLRQFITALLHGPALPIPQLGFAGAPVRNYLILGFQIVVNG